MVLARTTLIIPSILKARLTRRTALFAAADGSLLRKTVVLQTVIDVVSAINLIILAFESFSATISHREVSFKGASIFTLLSYTLTEASRFSSDVRIGLGDVTQWARWFVLWR